MTEMDWVMDIENDLNSTAISIIAEKQQWQKRSIYRVPACVAELNKRAYTPKVISLGPYHHGERHLEPMEVHKRRALLHFLKRSKKSLQSAVDFVAGDLTKLRDAYDDSIYPEWCLDSKFMKMMIMDGCFVLEMLSRNSKDDYAENDPIFSEQGRLQLLPFIQGDMLMLENQLPMLLLLKLFAFRSPNINAYQTTYFPRADEINTLILDFFQDPPWEGVRFGECLHVLDVKRRYLIGSGSSKQTTAAKEIETDNKQQQQAIQLATENIDTIRSATELREAGVKFKKKECCSISNITFSFKDGLLELPQLIIDDSTESTFLNLLAFERCHVDAGNTVTAYICFMDAIIDNAKDVSLLHKKKIVTNAIGSDEAAAELFNGIISKYLLFSPESRLADVISDVNRYCQRPWNRHKADLRHTYFTNPWAIISVIGAAILFALTLLSTFYSIYPYYNPNN